MLPFQATDPNAVIVGSRNPRLLSSKLNSQDVEDLGVGESQFYLLPSCSNWADFRAAGWQGYLPGAFYNSIRIKAYGDRFGRALRVEQNNALTEAYWKLFNTLCPNKKIDGTELDKIKKAGFDAGIDNRCLLNVVRETVKGTSRLRWLDAAAERPGADLENLKRKRLLTNILEAIGGIYKNTNQQLLGIEIERAALLKIGVEFNGEIAQYKYVMPEFGPAGYIIRDLTNAIPGFTLQQLDEARAYAAEKDKLPGLDQIPALMENPAAVEILGLPRTRLQANPSMAPVSQFAPPAGVMYQAAPGAAQGMPAVGAPPIAPPGVAAPTGAPMYQVPPGAALGQPPVASPGFQHALSGAPPATGLPAVAGLPPVAAPPPVTTMTPASAAQASAHFAATLSAAKAQQAQPGVPPQATPGSF